jgi:hypothetical protein
MSMQTPEKLRGALEPSPRRSDQPYESVLDLESDLSESALAPRRARRISQEDVFRTADELLLAGHRPTIDRVRMALGRGSPNTINDHLDAWWAKLGSRLRDLPGREFPQLPEAVARSLLSLWNTALEGAQEALHATLETKDSALAGREQAVEAQLLELAQRQAEFEARETALAEALSFARSQVTEGNLRAATLESALKDRDAEREQIQAQIEALQDELVQQRRHLDSERNVAAEQRVRDQNRYEHSEARWLMELDRTRVSLKDSERRAHELQARVASLGKELDAGKFAIVELKAELRTARAASEQLKARIQPPRSLQAQQRTKAKGSSPGTIARVSDRSTGQRRRAKKQPTQDNNRT